MATIQRASTATKDGTVAGEEIRWCVMQTARGRGIEGGSDCIEERLMLSDSKQ